MAKTDKTRKAQALVSNILDNLRPNGKSHSVSKSKSSSSHVMATTSLVGKVAVVTGSSRSIGAAIAKALGAEGANVVVNYVSDAGAAEEVASAIKSSGKGDAIAVRANAATIEGGRSLIDAAVQKWGHLDILVLNAGIMGSKVLADVDEAFFDSHIQTNVKAPLFTVKYALPHLSTRTLFLMSCKPAGGRIIFFSSSLTAASTVLPNALSYVASKGAIEQISRVLAKDLGGRGITVNTISPGPVDTPLFRTGKPNQVIDFISKQNPNNRLGLPEDIAPMVAFVASPAAQWLNGQNLRINGVSAFFSGTGAILMEFRRASLSNSLFPLNVL
ncbi:NAD(P)-binding protein [Macrolepiota fuliginosa MF-IS2]|uniref:NAD(P)-binding protein n=1 Tax=Macrolepiota fuliginosa MF-IS2 TaxID=1400762 RepID=A0A9P5X5Y7_9AGAR|nr:NAD(P)-binding protein [Macrolepiota fuliginosa MF-IS2]